MNINEICKQFNLSGTLFEYELLPSGNINTTYRVVCKDGDETYEYLLQKINKNVFKSPEKIMDNIIRVSKYISEHNTSGKLCVFNFNTVDGVPYLIDELGDFWRCRQFLDCVVFDETDDLFVIEEAGAAFGEFQYLLNGFDAASLYVSIKDFHNTPVRLKNCESAIKYAVGERKQTAKAEIEYILENKARACVLADMLKKGELPLRVTHNDTKCNNVVFNKDTLKSLAVIDLDTIMPGLTAYDFGDGARSICASVKEDEADISKVNFDLKKFDSFAKGYLRHLGKVLTENEIKTLGISVFVLTFELASRFLEDYLNGDTYFKVRYAEHNLVRAKNQIALAKDILNKLGEINAVIEKYSK